MATRGTCSNSVFALGSNGSGQLGIGHNQDVSIPRQVLFGSEAEPAGHVVRVAAGGNHTLLLTSDGKLYCAGDSSTGACGPLSTEKKESTRSFHVYEAALPGIETGGPAPVKLIAATWEASVVVQADSHGKNTILSTFGNGEKGELGQGHFTVRTSTVSRVENFPPPETEVIDLAACMGHVVAVLSNGDVYGWGNGRKGQLGTANKGLVHEPHKIEGMDFKAARAVCGRDFTCLFGRNDNSRLLVLGSDRAGVESSAPTTIDDWKDVGASWGSVFILKRDGSLMSWGRNDHGQLAPQNLPELDRITIGSEHAVALTKGGEALAWGWGEHGNCGPQVENGDVKGRWNVIASKKYIKPGSEIIGIGAGCATSWVSIETPSQP